MLQEDKWANMGPQKFSLAPSANNKNMKRRTYVIIIISGKLARLFAVMLLTVQFIMKMQYSIYHETHSGCTDAIREKNKLGTQGKKNKLGIQDKISTDRQM